MVLWVVTMDGHAVDQHHTAKVGVVNMVDVMVAIANLHNHLLEMVDIDVVLILVLEAVVTKQMEPRVQVIVI